MQNRNNMKVFTTWKEDPHIVQQHGRLSEAELGTFWN